jgi:DNA primase
MKNTIKNYFAGVYIRFYSKYLEKTSKAGDDEFKAKCPFPNHEDKNPSFNFNNKNGRYKCHGCGNKGDIFQFFAQINGMDTKRDFIKILTGIAADFGIPYENEKRQVVEEYVYIDLSGKPLHRTVRTEPKAFYQERYEDGKWVSGLKGIETVLYNLPDVTKADEVIIVEGEKDADNLKKLRFPATTCPMGAGKWRTQYNEALKGNHIVLLPDNDDAGRKHMMKVAESLNGTAKSIKLINLPGLEPGGDVSDFILKINDADSTLEKLSIIIDGAEEYDPNKNIKIEEDKIQQRAEEILDTQQPCGKFDTSKLPEILQDYISEICETTEADTIIITQSLLTTISAMLKKRVYIPEGEYFQKLYPNLWMLTIAPSGDFKSTALNKGAKVAWERETEVNEQIEASEMKELKKEELGQEIKKARQRSAILANRSTAEALLEHLADDCGGMIMCSEFGEWLENMEKTHNKGLKALFTALYDVPQQYTYHTKNGGYLVISEPYITLNGISTLTWVRKGVRPDDVSSGFFARFLIFYPPQIRSIPPALPPLVLKQRDYQAHDRIREILIDPSEKSYRLSVGAKEYFGAVHTELYQVMRQQSERTQEILNPYLKRWSPYILKLAMIMQIFFDPETDIIDTQAIEAAKSIVDYAIKSTTFLFENSLDESEEQTKQRVVLEYIAEKDGQVDRATLQSSKKLKGGAKDYDDVCESLEAAGKTVIHKPDENKKGTWYYTVAP